MKIYLNKKIESIPIFKKLLILMEGVSTHQDLISDFKDIDDISEVKHLYDPVRDFLEFYISSSNISMDQGRQDYIVNALYAAKGAPKVFEIFDEVFQVQIKYEYDFPVIKIIEFINLKISDVILFINKFINMLYYLLYYTEITIHIKNLLLSLQGQLIQYNSGLILGYDSYDITTIEYGLKY